jgi:multimeric flavodoxin WrbA
MTDLSEKLKVSDAFVIVSPEWHGMATSGLKNFFMLCSSTSGLEHKPALICSVSAVDGGAYVVAELRASSYKNNRLCYIPENLIVRNVGSVLNDDDSLNDPEAHPYFVDRSAYCLRLLAGYADAMRSLRTRGLIDHETYPNGM